MEKKEITVQGYETETGQRYVTAQEIGRKISELKGIETQKNENNVIRDNPFAKMNPTIHYEYVDNPDELEDNVVLDFFDRITICIKDGTKIIGRRKKDGKKR